MANGPTTATTSARQDGNPNPTAAHAARRRPGRIVTSTVIATATTGTAMLISGAMPACGSARAIDNASRYVTARNVPAWRRAADLVDSIDELNAGMGPELVRNAVPAEQGYPGFGSRRHIGCGPPPIDVSPPSELDLACSAMDDDRDTPGTVWPDAPPS